MNKLVQIIALSCVLLVCSCSSYDHVTAPTVSGISGFKIGKLAEGKLPLSFNTTLKNPDKLKFHVKRVNLELIFAGVRVAELKSERKMKIRRQIESEIHWEVVAELAPLLKKPGALLGTLFRGKIDFEVSGTMTIGKFLWSKTVPVKLKLPVEIPAF